MNLAFFVLNLLFGFWNMSSFVMDPEGAYATYLLITGAANIFVAGGFLNMIIFDN